MTLNDTSKQIDELVISLPKRDLVSRFVAVFSRFEYALKATRFLDGDTNQAKAQWDEFAEELSNLRGYRDASVKAAIELFDKEPPRKQVVSSNGLNWKDDPITDTTNVSLFKMVRRIRNNLFHGGKTPFIPRDEELLTAGLVLMTAALNLHEEVRKKFLEHDAYGTL